MSDTLIGGEAIDALFARVESLLDGPAQEQFFMHVGGRVGVFAEGIAREMPERREGVPLPLAYTLDGKPSKFKSRKQRAFVMRLSKQGKIPRTRTGFLANSMTHEVTVLQGGAIVAVGTNLQGAEYVLDIDRQNRYLASLGWVALQTRFAEHTDDFKQVTITAGQGFLDGYIAGKQ
jgi:hypothetical protein